MAGAVTLLHQSGSVFRPLLVQEAAVSVAMSHSHGPTGCDVCLAANGDPTALMRLFLALEEQEGKPA